MSFFNNDPSALSSFIAKTAAQYRSYREIEDAKLRQIAQEQVNTAALQNAVNQYYGEIASILTIVIRETSPETYIYPVDFPEQLIAEVPAGKSSTGFIYLEYHGMYHMGYKSANEMCRILQRRLDVVARIRGLFPLKLFVLLKADNLVVFRIASYDDVKRCSQTEP